MIGTHISSAAKFFGSIRLNSVSMRAACFGSSAIAWRTVAAISVMTSCENDASAGEGAFGAIRRSASSSRPARLSAVFLVELLQRPIGLGGLPDVAHDRFVVEHLVVAVDNTTEDRMQVPGALYRRQPLFFLAYLGSFCQKAIGKY